MIRKKQSKKHQRRQIGGINPKNPADEKATPPLTLLLKTEVNAKSAHHKKTGTPIIPMLMGRKYKNEPALEKSLNQSFHGSTS